MSDGAAEDRLDLLADELHEPMPDRRGRQYLVHLREPERRLRHVRKGRLGGVLDDGPPSRALDGDQPVGAVVEEAGEYDRDHALAVRDRGGPEHGVDRGPGTVLPRTVRELHDAVLDQQVPVRRSDERPSRLDPLTVRGVGDRNSGGGRQDLRQMPGRLRADVEGDEQGARKIGG